MVSIIVPTLNRCKALNSALESLSHLATSPNLFEIIIVDNGSTDNTSEVVKDFMQFHPEIILKYFCDTIPGLLTGRHRGAQEAKGDILTFIDDDVIVSPNWLNNIIETMTSRNDISLLTGPCLPAYENDPPEWLSFFWTKTKCGDLMCGWLSLLDLGNIPKETDPNFVWGLNFTIRKKDFYELGGFHPDNIPSDYQMFQGDGEIGLTMKAKRANKKAFYHPGVKLCHQVPNSRLTYEYFDKRAYYQGVCNSFTFLREKYYYNIANKLPNRRKPLPLRLLFYSKKFILQKLNIVKESPHNEIEMLKMRLKRKEREGFSFHQNAFETNPIVRKWVLQNNYLDYNLPELS